MKFGKQLRFVAVKAWFEHYIQYKGLKRLIKSFTEAVNQAIEEGKSEEEIAALKDECYESFREALVDNVNDTIKFFSKLLTEATEKIERLAADIDEQLEEQEDTEKSEEIAIQLSKRIFVSVLNLYEIRTFLAINDTGTFCIAKKFAKKLGYPAAAEEFKQIRESAFDHQPTIDEQLREIEELHLRVRRDIFPEGDKRPRQEIILDLHKSVENSLLWKQATVLGKWQAFTFRQTEFELSPARIKWIPIVVGFILMLPFMVVRFFPEGKMEAQRCLGILILCATLWATSAVPLWLTSMSIPFFTVVARLIPNVAIRDVGKLIQASTMSSTVYLIVGGFTIAAAFKETEMDKRIAAMALSRATRTVSLFLFVVIALNAFLAMWINNVASTMIVVTLVAPTLAQVPTDSAFAKLILLGIAGGGNFGGMTTPLSSPQNAVTIQAVENAQLKTGDRKSFGFVEFLATAFPPGLVGCVIFWGLLQLMIKNDVPKVPPFQKVNTDFGWRQIIVSIVTVATIVIWIVLPFGAENVLADNGIVGFIPFLIFYGTGILPGSRLADLPWNILFLVMGGNALGYVVEHSGLLHLVSSLLQSWLGGQSLWVTLLILDIFVLVINVFVSHTVAATILLPIVCEFALNDPHMRLYAMQACLATTASQILPVSSFPNLCCVSLQDKNGKEYLKTTHIMKSGSMATAICFVLLISVQYGIAVAYGL